MRLKSKKNDVDKSSRLGFKNVLVNFNEKPKKTFLQTAINTMTMNGITAVHRCYRGDAISSKSQTNLHLVF